MVLWKIRVDFKGKYDEFIHPDRQQAKIHGDILQAKGYNILDISPIDMPDDKLEDRIFIEGSIEMNADREVLSFKSHILQESDEVLKDKFLAEPEKVLFSESTLTEKDENVTEGTDRIVNFKVWYKAYQLNIADWEKDCERKVKNELRKYNFQILKENGKTIKSYNGSVFHVVSSVPKYYQIWNINGVRGKDGYIPFIRIYNGRNFPLLAVEHPAADFVNKMAMKGLINLDIVEGALIDDINNEFNTNVVELRKLHRILRDIMV